MKSIRASAPILLFGFLYIIINVIYFHPFSHNFKHTIFMPGGDQESFIWFIYWWPYAIIHGLNPFITHYAWSPSGFNLAWATSIPTLSILTAPLTIMFGPIFSWNLLSLLAAPLNAFCAFLLLRYLYKNNIAAFLGGYIFGYSSYVMGQLLGHLNLDLVFLVPTALLFFIMRINGDIRRHYFIAIMATIIFLEAGISTEVLATGTLFGFISIAIFFIFYKDIRGNLFKTSLDLVLAYIIALIMLSPFIYFLVKGFSELPKVINSPSSYSSDMLNYIIPTPITRIGRSIFSNIASRFTGNYAEEGAYLGFPLILLTAFSFKDYITKKNLAGISLIAILVVIVVFSLGPELHINGIDTHFLLPWTFFTHVPLIRGALPTRFTDYVSLVVSIVVAFWMSNGIKNIRYKRYLIALFSIIFIVPNLAIYNWGSPAVPHIFKRNIINNTNDIVLPFGYTGPSMFWQLESGMKFHMVGGYVGFNPLPFRRMQVTADLYSGKPTRGFNNLFKAYCARFHVNHVIVCQNTPVLLEQSISNEGWPYRKYGKCTLYNVPNKMQYFEYTGDTWGSYNKYGWIGKKVSISTNDFPIKILLSGKFIPKQAHPVNVIIKNPHGKLIQKTFTPGEKSRLTIYLIKHQKVTIISKNTWVPNNVIHNGDTRDLSISMKIEKYEPS